MKNKRANDLTAGLLAFVLSVSAVGNLMTGYDLPVASVRKIVFWCALFAMGTMRLLRVRHERGLLILIAAGAVFLIWKKDALWQQTQYVSYILSSHYHAVYDWPVIGAPHSGDVSLLLILWAALTAWGINWYLIRGKHIPAAILPAVLPLVLCLITNDRVPEPVYLYLLILAVSLLLITDWTRKKDPAQGMKLVFRIAVPIGLCLALLFMLNPREEYVNHAASFQKTAMGWFQKAQDSTAAVNGASGLAVNERVNLRTVGPKSKRDFSVMRINAPEGGILYLRGRDYDRYTGSGWEASADRSEVFTSGNRQLGELTVVTYGVREVLYVPYYPNGAISLQGGARENVDNLQRYTYFLSDTNDGRTEIPEARYREIPDETRLWAEEKVSQIIAGAASTGEKIQLIQEYVRDSAVYDLSTPRMEPDYTDFARWFLEESESGYCVHFATAATVLLRAAGIPARYVEGYMVRCKAGTDVVVSSQDAHAWTEYYDMDARCWRVLEATPSEPETEVSESAAPTTIPEETDEKEPEIPERTPSKPSEDQNTVPEKRKEPSETVRDEQTRRIRIPDWVKKFFIFLVLAACIPLQAFIRICRKRVCWNLGRPNERLVFRWRYTRDLAKKLDQPYPEKLNELAQKAIFSQHRIQAAELQEFEDYRIFLLTLVRSRPWYVRLYFKWMLAIE